MYIVALQHSFRTVALQHGFVQVHTYKASTVQVAIFPHVVGDYLKASTAQVAIFPHVVGDYLKASTVQVAIFPHVVGDYLKASTVQVAIFPHVVGDYLICTYCVAICEMRLSMLYVCCSTWLLILDLAVCMTVWKKVEYSIYIQL